MSYPDRYHPDYDRVMNYPLASGWINPARMADEVIDFIVNEINIPVNQLDIKVDEENDTVSIEYEQDVQYFEIQTNGQYVWIEYSDGIFEHIPTQRNFKIKQLRLWKS